MTRRALVERRSWYYGPIGCLSFCLSLAGPLHAHEPDAEPGPAPTAAELAAQHFEAALAHADNRELERAAAEFEQAYALSPHYSVLYNLGLSYAALGQSQKAIVAFERYLAGGGDAIDDPRRSRVAALIGEERAKLGRLELSVTPSHATIKLDERAVLAEPEGIVLDPGRHRLVLQAPGHAEHVEELDLQPGATAALSIRLTPVEPPLLIRLTPVEPAHPEPLAVPPRAVVVPGKPTAHDPESEPTTGALPALLLGAGGLTLSAALVTYLYSNDRYGDWRARRVELPAVARTEAERRAEAQNDALEREINTLDAVALGLSLGGAALVAGAAWLHLSPDEPATASTGVLGIDVAGSTLRVRGAF